MSQRRYQEVILPTSEDENETTKQIACVLAASGRTLIRMGRDGWKVVREGTCDTKHFENRRALREYAESVRVR
tara:strand:- start:533 stop:751 length:219 start_codon:yes stop_codon:yes gene_type:complete